MSFKSYSKWWIKTKGQAQELWEQDQFAIKKAKATKKRPLAFNLVSGLYARYAMLVQEIDTCLDQMCQVGVFLLIYTTYLITLMHRSLKNVRPSEK